MPDLWDEWDRRLKHNGRPNRVASDLTNAEIVRMLASETSGRLLERRLLGDELFARLHRQEGGLRRPPPEEASWPTLGPEAGP